jgi:hypothetical protein
MTHTEQVKTLFFHIYFYSALLLNPCFTGNHEIFAVQTASLNYPRKYQQIIKPETLAVSVGIRYFEIKYN